jgi:hypothetical protein
MGPGLQLQRVVRASTQMFHYLALFCTRSLLRTSLFASSHFVVRPFTLRRLLLHTSSFAPLHSTSHSLFLRLRYAALSMFYPYSPLDSCRSFLRYWVRSV